MEELFPERLGEFYGMLAYHYSKSENREKAHYYLFQAGNKAVKSHSLWEAYEFYRDAVEVLDTCPQTEQNLKQQIVIISAMAPVTRMLAYPDGSLEFLEKGEKLAREVEDSRRLVSLSSMIANYYTFKGGNPLIGRKYLERSFLEAECTEDVELLAPLATDLFVSYMATGEFRRTQEMAPKVINLIRKTGRQQDFFGRPATPYLSCLLHWGVSYGRQGYLDEANRILDEARRFGVQTEHHFGLGLIEGQNGAVYLWLGDTENSIRHITQSIKHFEDAQAPLWQGQLWTWLGYAYHLQGESDTAIRYIAKGLKMQSDLGSQTWFCTHHMFYGAVQLDIGELSKAAESLESAINIAEENKESDNLAYSKILLGRTIAKIDSSHYGQALEHILNGIQMLEDLGLKPMYSQGYLFLCEVYSAMGKREDALESLKRAQSLFREMGMDYWLGKTQEVLARL
jgi:tetratricopeptide (TPR) repeat protein